MKQITIYRGQRKAYFTHPTTQAAVLEGIYPWFGDPGLFDRLAVEAFAEAVAADGMRHDFGELCVYLKVWVTWTPVVQQEPLF